ncbi:hypothetical protein M441DRAFT_254633 [Trichoderma asperellum CBS 433.97]|uniref:Uncharacterized protein n=1 Tax=Trichoderma asperellum (strain ATCC 204424 / CBS 433.97 / NBRC 101777) TaxID=1042311 RepID=A0A2T3YYL2_TRIA4|nr:hypothetical protein M441DRAFT_254633 [Trichoderma asperellum CBS 433.97]PTB37610.1 hypothetical protein M441DRAFT_254633 [Trichoderma asperellum CBS 433.97]
MRSLVSLTNVLLLYGTSNMYPHLDPTPQKHLFDPFLFRAPPPLYLFHSFQASTI